MSPIALSITIVSYFIILFAISYIAGHKADNSTSVIDAIVYDRYIPLVATLSPVLCYILQKNSEDWFGRYQISYELLIINAFFTFLGLCLLIKRKEKKREEDSIHCSFD